MRLRYAYTQKSVLSFEIQNMFLLTFFTLIVYSSFITHHSLLHNTAKMTKCPTFFNIGWCKPPARSHSASTVLKKKNNRTFWHNGPPCDAGLWLFDKRPLKSILRYELWISNSNRFNHSQCHLNDDFWYFIKIIQYWNFETNQCDRIVGGWWFYFGLWL